MSIKASSFASALGGAMVFTFATAALAAPSAVNRSPAKVADASPPHATPVSESEDEAACSKSRKRLWVEGEGWIVRKVTTCR